jgi:HTH-type transcriptional regulator / antitoxin HigA
MRTKNHLDTQPLPTQFEQLVQMMPPQAIQDEVQYANTLEVIDRLMVVAKLTKGQALYLETLVQLVQAYEAEHHAIDTTGLTGLDSLKHLLEENQMNASDLARLLGVHASLGSKIFKGERSLTVAHLRKLAERFKVSPGLFFDGRHSSVGGRASRPRVRGASMQIRSATSSGCWTGFSLHEV